MTEARKIILEARRTHKHWADFLREHPKFRTKHIGDIAHHLDWIKRYNIVLRELK